RVPRAPGAGPARAPSGRDPAVRPPVDLPGERRGPARRAPALVPRAASPPRGLTPAGVVWRRGSSADPMLASRFSASGHVREPDPHTWLASPAVRDRRPAVAAERLRPQLHARRSLAALVLGAVDHCDRP